jgi:polyisoprenyl-phosphate glycosyltransferase
MNMEIELSVVLPCYCESDNIPIIYESLTNILKNNVSSYELIFVDDGSTDVTSKAIKDIANYDKRVILVRLSRNFGHQAALLAGYKTSKGKAVISMDSDLQHPPEIIPEMLDAWRNGADIVLGVRKDTKKISFLKKTTSSLFYYIFRKLSKIDIPSGAADYRLIDSNILNILLTMREKSLFLRGLIQWMGFNVSKVQYIAEERLHGKSAYNYRKMLLLAFDGILSFTGRPLRICSSLAILVSGAIFCYIVFIIIAKLLSGQVVPGWASIVGMVSILGIIQSLFLAVLAEYIERIYNEVKDRPLYLISEVFKKEQSEENTKNDN